MINITREEAIAIIHKEYLCVDRDCDIERSCGKCDLMMPSKEPILQAFDLAIQALSQEPREDDHDGCKDCRYESQYENEIPCMQCKQNYTDKWQKKPHWIDREVYDADRWKCSECGRTEPYKENYCPNCGARMVEPQESEE